LDRNPGRHQGERRSVRRSSPLEPGRTGALSPPFGPRAGLRRPRRGVRGRLVRARRHRPRPAIEAARRRQLASFTRPRSVESAVPTDRPKSAAVTLEQAPSLNLDLKQLRALLRLLSKRDVAEFEFEDEHMRIRLARGARARAAATDGAALVVSQAPAPVP